jgi:hypothetical protein
MKKILTTLAASAVLVFGMGSVGAFDYPNPNDFSSYSDFESWVSNNVCGGNTLLSDADIESTAKSMASAQCSSGVCQQYGYAYNCGEFSDVTCSRCG